MSSPVSNRAAPQPTPDDQPPAPPEALTVGVIEDSDEDFAIFSRVFRRFAAGAQVQRWTRAEAALDSLIEGELPRRPDVLVVDLSLPGIDGCELVRRLRHHPETAQVPMFMLSGSEREYDISRCLDAGATGYFRKSTRAADLLAALDHILAAAKPGAEPMPGAGS